MGIPVATGIRVAVDDWGITATAVASSSCGYPAATTTYGIVVTAIGADISTTTGISTTGVCVCRGKCKTDNDRGEDLFHVDTLVWDWGCVKGIVACKTGLYIVLQLVDAHFLHFVGEEFGLDLFPSIVLEGLMGVGGILPLEVSRAPVVRFIKCGMV